MNKENLANAFIDGSLSDTATSVDLKTGYVTYQPTTPYFATITPFGELSTKANSEIVEVTNKSGDTLTIVRGQRGTTAKNFADGAIFSNGIYVEDLEAKLDKSGGTITGDLDVEGNIYSNGVKVGDTISGERQDIDSNSTFSGYRVQTGWGYKTGISSSFMEYSVTFPVEFSSLPIVLPTNAGARSGSNPSSLTDLKAASAEIVTAKSITTSGFTVVIATRNSANLSTSVRYGFSWIAIGPI